MGQGMVLGQKEWTSYTDTIGIFHGNAIFHSRIVAYKGQDVTDSIDAIVIPERTLINGTRCGGIINGCDSRSSIATMRSNVHKS